MSDHPKQALAVFAALPQAARDARTFTIRVLDSWGLLHLSDTASLLVSELITNALKHAGGDVDPPADLIQRSRTAPRVTLGVSLADSLLVEVWDGSSTLPARRTATDDQEDGRGLLLVEALSKEWGCTLLAPGGKITWFVLDCGPR